jgi:hypothetical protein
MLMSLVVVMVKSTKVCTKCKQEKPVEDFSKNGKSKAGTRVYRPDCKICCNTRVTKHYYTSLNKQLWYKAKSRAKRDGLPFNITPEDIVIPNWCPVLGIQLKRGEGKCSANSPTIDKMVPALGYVKGNITIMSHRANTIKNDATLEEIQSVYEWMQEHKAP